MQALLNAITQNGLSHAIENKDDLSELVISNSASYSKTMTQQVKEMLQGRLPGTVDEVEPVNHAEVTQATFPLTDIQYAYLIGRNTGLELGGVASCLYFEWDMNDIEIPRLEVAFNQTVEHHPMLRAVVRGSGQQEVLDSVAPYAFSQEDARDWDGARQADYLQQTREAMEQALRPLDQPSSFDIRITRLSDTTIRMHVYFDLMFLDMPSVRRILHDWWLEYQQPGSLSPAEGNPFSAYLQVERQWRDGLQGQSDRRYWEAIMDTLPPAPELPLAQAPERLDRPAFKRSSCTLTSDWVTRLKSVAQKRGLTLETVLLGAYTEVIRQWSRHPSFTLTVTQTGRRFFFEGVESLVGNFLQPELLAVRSDSSDRLVDRWVQLQTDMLLNRWHSSYNGVQVLRDMIRRGGETRVSSAPVVFSNTLTADLNERIPDIGWDNAQSVYSSSQTPQVWLENQIVRENGEVTVNWNYVADLFPVNMVDRMLERYVALLRACAEDSAVWHQTGSVVELPDDDKQARQRANDTACNLDLQPLHALFLRMAEQQPDAVAVVQGDRRLTYGALLQQSTRLAVCIRERITVDRGDILAVSLPQGPDQLIGLLGVLFAGGAYVAIDPAWPVERRNRLLARCAVKGMVGNETTFPNMAAFSELPCFTINDELNNSRAFDFLPIIQTLDDLAYVIFTSGSTGEPKGVMVSHRNAANTVLDINRRFNVTSQDAVLSVAPAGFDLSVYDYFGLLAAGGRVVFQSSPLANDPHQWARDITEQGVTIWNSVPAPMKVLVDHCGPELSASALRLVLMSGDWIPVDLPCRIHQWLPETLTISLGGATEGSIWSICYPIESVDEGWTSIPYGFPLANQEFHVLNDWMEPCPRWVTGELYIAGTGVAKGYLGDPEKTAQRFVQHPTIGKRLYKTGDLGRYIDEALIEILGREDAQVKINGYRVELGEIEACLLTEKGADHIVIDAPLHPKTGQRQIVAYVVPTPDQEHEASSAFEQRLQDTAQKKLPTYMVPSYIIVLSSMPLTPNGKIDRKALPAPWGDAGSESPEQAEPENDLEHQLLVLWQRQLQHQDIGVTQGFFDVGGDSLHAVGLLSAIRESFEVPDSAEQAIIEGLFMNACIRTFSGILEKLTESKRMGDL